LANGGFTQLLADYVLSILPILICFVPAITLSSYVKARLAYHFGDSTAKVSGRMTLWPVHFDIVGTLSLLAFYPGWGSPTPINISNLEQNRWRVALVEASGVLTNLALGLGTLLLTWLFSVLQPLFNLDLRFFIQPLEFFSTFNLFFAIFHLLPIPPLTGFRILVALFYHKPQGVLDSKAINLTGSLILIILFIWTPLISWLIIPTKMLTGLLGSTGQAYFSYFSKTFFSRGF
jgi:Zn-dependent protease